jgi:uncharacterized protein (TIGR02001 family)
MRLGWLAALALTSGLAAQEAAAPAWTFSSEIGAVSMYVWRGFVLNDAPALQPSLTLGYRGLSVNSFSSYSEGAFTEHDIEVDYSRELGAFTWSVGYANYYQFALPDSPSCLTHEIYAGISRTGLLEPSFRLSRDVAEGDGYYWYGSIGHSFSVRKRISIQPTLGVGLNQHLYQPHTTISNVDLGIAAEFRINSRLTATPSFLETIGHRTLFGRHRAFGIVLTLER